MRVCKNFLKAIQDYPCENKTNILNNKKQPDTPKGRIVCIWRASAPKFEPFAKISKDNPEKVEFETETEIDKTGTVNKKAETKNNQKCRHKVQNKKLTPAIQKFSNHIEFIDYIPIHEIITYRHLFAYGFYVE